MREVIGMARRAPILSAAVVDSKAVVSVAPLAASARFSLRLPPDAAVEIGTVAGLRLDIPINTCICAGERTAARLGPDEWLLLGPEVDCEFLERDIATPLADCFFSLVDIGHRDVTMVVAGLHVREVINGGCPLDLYDAAFPAGSATRTLFGKAEIVLMRRSAEHVYLVECLRSFAPYVHGLLNDVAREFEST